VALTTFVDTSCKEACPISVAALGRTLRRLDPATRRQVTDDPAVTQLEDVRPPTR
jgi:cytochrome oxidase Cu insertion factor (SCO1/SenC/PrrC family)